MTQRLVVGGGKSAMVSGLPSGPMTYLTLGRWGSIIGTLLQNKTRLTDTAESYKPRLKICLSMANVAGRLCTVRPLLAWGGRRGSGAGAGLGKQSNSCP